jgi:hypothetical protein
MADNGLEHALKAIDPVARAMLDLSIRRRLPDSSIADLAQMPPDELVRWRGEVLDQLGTQIGLTGPDARDEVRARLEAIDPSAWTGAADAPATPASTPPAKPSKPAKEPKPSKPKRDRERPSGRLLALLALLVVVVIAVAAISLSGDDSDEPAPAPLPTTTTTTKPPDSTTTSTTDKPPSTTTTTTAPPTTEPVTMEPLAGMPDRGTATVSITGEGEERSIEVSLKGMPAPGKGVYELWLYNTLIGAMPLGTLDSGDGSISAPLPADAADFRYLDLSREDAGDDRIHSGVSVRRTELAPLLDAQPTP